MSENLKLWDQVQKTDPKHVKLITGKSYQGNSPKPHYLIHKATETFGPIGIGWGFNIVDERIEEGAGGERMSIARVRVWYEWEGKRGEVEHIGGTSFSGMRSSGKPFTDEDAPKKSVTDALVKALSMIGFAGDIFMGRWDDAKYQEELRNEASPKSEPPKPIERMSEDNPDAVKLRKRLNDKLLELNTPSDIEKFWAQQTVGEALAVLPEAWAFDLIHAKGVHIDTLRKPKKNADHFKPVIPPDFTNMESDIPYGDEDLAREEGDR